MPDLGLTEDQAQDTSSLASAAPVAQRLLDGTANLQHGRRCGESDRSPLLVDGDPVPHRDSRYVGSAHHRDCKATRYIQRARSG